MEPLPPVAGFHRARPSTTLDEDIHILASRTSTVNYSSIFRQT